jgi:hypothetical protein
VRILSLGRRLRAAPVLHRRHSSLLLYRGRANEYLLVPLSVLRIREVIAQEGGITDAADVRTRGVARREGFEPPTRFNTFKKATEAESQALLPKVREATAEFRLIGETCFMFSEAALNTMADAWLRTTGHGYFPLPTPTSGQETLPC